MVWIGDCKVCGKLAGLLDAKLAAGYQHHHLATVGPVLLKIFINNLDDGNEWDALFKFVSDTKSRVVVTLQSNAAGLNKLKTWCDRSS